MYKNTRAIAFIAALTLTLLNVTACTDSRAEEVRVFNEYTEQTITDYQRLQKMLAGRDEQLIEALRDDSIDSQYLADDTMHFEQESRLLQGAALENADNTPLVTESGIFTSIGANSNTQILKFTIGNTQFVLEILWVEDKIDSLSLKQVTANVD